jgi:hypothetical protein
MVRAISVVIYGGFSQRMWITVEITNGPVWMRVGFSQRLGVAVPITNGPVCMCERVS